MFDLRPLELFGGSGDNEFIKQLFQAFVQSGVVELELSRDQQQFHEVAVDDGDVFVVDVGELGYLVLQFVNLFEFGQTLVDLLFLT